MDHIYKDEQQVKKDLQEIGWKRIIESVEETFVEEAEGRCDCPPKRIMFLPNGNDIREMIARMDKYPYVGHKLISANEKNPGKGLPLAMGTFQLVNVDTSELLMFCKANELTAFRTAAATAVAVRYLAPKKQRLHVGIIGCGKQASYHIAAIREVLREHCDFWVYDVDTRKALNLAYEYYDTNCRLKLDILQNADVIVTLTPTTEPHIFAKDIDFDRDVLFCAVGGDNEKKIEIHQDVLSHMHIFCDSYKQVKHTGIMHRLNFDPWPISLGDFIVNKSGIVEDIPKGARLFISTGVALQDLAMGRLIYEDTEG